MRRHSMRLFVAVLTFTFGISIFWASQLIRQVKITLVDHFLSVNNSDVSPVTLVRLNSVKTQMKSKSSLRSLPNLCDLCVN